MLLILASLILSSFAGVVISAENNHSNIEYGNVMFVNGLTSAYYVTAVNSVRESQDYSLY